MDEFKLRAGELKHLRGQHRAMKRKRAADRIKAIVLLGSGWSVLQVCEALLLDADTIRRYRTRYQQGGLHDLLQDQYQGKPSKLDEAQRAELCAHPQTELYLTVQAIIVHVKRQTGFATAPAG